MAQAIPTAGKSLLTPQDHTLILIDHQSQMAFATKSIDPVLLRNNTALVAKSAAGFGVSTILTTVAEKSFSGPVFAEITEAFPNIAAIDRTTMNTWEDARIADEVNRIGKSRIVFAGLWTSVCIVGPALSALDQGFEVYVIADACGDVSDEAHERAMQRMIQAGARPMTSLQYLLELQRDWARAETYELTTSIARANGGGYGLGVTYAKTMFGAVEGGHPLPEATEVLVEEAETPLTMTQAHDLPRENAMADLIVRNARITTLDPGQPSATALAVANGVIVAIGDEAKVMEKAGNGTRVVDASGRRLVPGLNDSHTHLIRGGLNYNLELRWDGVRSLADAMAMLKAQVARTPAPQWVRVVGGFSEHQFAEKRLPTLAEINAIAPDTPVFILHLYDRALLNGAALRAVGYDKNTPNPPGGEIQRDKDGNPTGLLLAKPNALILYATLAAGPKLPFEYQVNSTKHFMRELNRLGITSVIDAGGGFQNYPDDYEVIQKLHAENELTVRIAYNLFTQKKGEEMADFEKWTGMLKPREGDDMLRHNGAGEMLVFSAADFEDFREPRPELPESLEGELESVVRLLAQKRWPFRIHATYDESIGRILDVYEKVDREVPFDGLHWLIDHAETITDRNIDRIKALGGGIAVQHRMAYQGEYFVERYGAKAAERTPPVRRMLEAGVLVGLGTDATRVASYNPWLALYWLTTGRTLGGLQIYGESNQLEREEALRLWTHGSAWFSSEQDDKGLLKVGQFADFTLLTADYFNVDDEAIKDITSVLTVVGGKVVHGDGEFTDLAPELPAPMPDWSPVRHFGGYQGATLAQAAAVFNAAHGHSHVHGEACHVHGHGHAAHRDAPVSDYAGFWGVLGCSCFAF